MPINSNKYMNLNTPYDTYVNKYGGGWFDVDQGGGSGNFNFKGTVASKSALPANPDVGDVYNVQHDALHTDGVDYIWTGTMWDALGDPEAPDVEVAIPLTWDDLGGHLFTLDDGTKTTLTWNDAGASSTKKVKALPRLTHNGITWNEVARYNFV